jgi:integrase
VESDVAGEKKLSALAVRNAGPGVHADGGSLYLSVSKSGSRRWLYRYRSGARVKDLGLGDATVISLADARTLRDRWRKELALGRDPIEMRRAEKVQGVTFGEIADRVLASPRVESLSNDKHRAQWAYSLKTLAGPLRARPVADMTTTDVLGVLKPLWADGKHETAARVRSRVERVIEVARSEGAVPDDKPNVARWRNHIELHAPRREAVKEHHAALPYQDAPAFMAWLRAKDAISARALEFTILCAARTGETLFATSAEIDFNGKVWTIPAERMKTRKEHRVPLCNRALEVAKEGQGRSYLFAGARGKPLSNMAMAELLKHRVPPEIATVHGFRSTFDQWASEVAHAGREVIERSLAHAVKGKTEAAYNRADLLDRRRPLMTQWEAYLKSAPPAQKRQMRRSNARHSSSSTLPACPSNPVQ